MGLNFNETTLNTVDLLHGDQFLFFQIKLRKERQTMFFECKSLRCRHCYKKKSPPEGDAERMKSSMELGACMFSSFLVTPETLSRIISKTCTAIYRRTTNGSER